MWKRRLGCGFLLFLFCLRQLPALPSDWRALDTQSLLAQAALVIEKLKNLNEELTKQAEESGRQSKELAAQLESLTKEKKNLLKDIENLQATLGKLQADWTESERMRLELASALKILQASLQSCREEATKSISKAGIVGLAVGLVLGVVIGVMGP